MSRISINLNRIQRGALVLSVLWLTACTTTQDALLTHDDHTMLDIWHREASSSQSVVSLAQARQSLHRPLTGEEVYAIIENERSYTRTAQNEIYRQFKRLPNPDLVMYVFPHLAGTEAVPVPGYSTVFPLYRRVQYALPGERVEED